MRNKIASQRLTKDQRDKLLAVFLAQRVCFHLLMAPGRTPEGGALMATFFETKWAHMSDIQREQCRVLVALIRELKTEVMQREMEREDISTVEPRLASPRSSLNPGLMA